MSQEIKKILFQFKTNRMIYDFHKRESNVAMYQVFKVRKGVKVGVGWEVHKVRILKIPHKVFKGIIYPPQMVEKLANNEQFGNYGWFYIHFENAQKRFEELCLESQLKV